MSTSASGLTNSIKITGIVGENSFSKTLSNIPSSLIDDPTTAEIPITKIFSTLYDSGTAKGFSLVQTTKFDIESD